MSKNIVKKWKIYYNGNYWKNKEALMKIKIITNILCSITILTLSTIQFILFYNNSSIKFYTALVIVILGYLILEINNIVKIIKLEKANKKFKQLENDYEKIQATYDRIRGFKHDFNNIMQGFGGYIKSRDLEGLENMYVSIVKECQEINEEQRINKQRINNPAIYNLIINKYIDAKKMNISMKVDVDIDLKRLKVSDVDLCRILGILLDNAIEATKDCQEKIIILKFIRDNLNQRDLIIIENPCKNLMIDIKKIYEKGFSNKKNKIAHGLGLWNVKQILKKNKNVHIYTTKGDIFKQQLEIY